MKKKLALSLALMFSLGITGTAFAAEPDMAAELASLKARMVELEKSMKTVNVAKKKDKDDKLNFEGSDFRIRWVKDDADGGDSVFQERVRLNMNYKVNDNITFNARWRLMNENELGSAGTGTDGNLLSDANVAIKNILHSTMTVGRYRQGFGATSYWNSTTLGLIDGIKFDTKFDNVKMAVGFANFGAYNTAKTTYTTTLKNGVYTTKATTAQTPALEDAAFLNANIDVSKATTLNLMWVKEKSGADSNFDVRGLGVKTKFADDWAFAGDYTKNYKTATQPTGYFLSLRWKDADDNIPGSYGLRLEYRDIKAGNMFSTSGNGVSIPTQNFKGPAICGQYAIDKNVILDGFQTFKSKNSNTGLDVPNYSRLQVTVGF